MKLTPFEWNFTLAVFNIERVYIVKTSLIISLLLNHQCGKGSISSTCVYVLCLFSDGTD